MIAKSPKIYTEEASRCLRDLERFLCAACEETSTGKRIFASPSLPSREAMALWQLLSKNKIATEMLKKMLQMFHPVKSRKYNDMHARRRLASTDSRESTAYREHSTSVQRGVSVHSRCNDTVLQQSPVLKYLSRRELVCKNKSARLHFYFDYQLHDALHSEYRSDINVHVTSLEGSKAATRYIPDLSIFDFAIGYEHIDYAGKYLDLSTDEESLSAFLENIFQSVDKHKKQQGTSILYFNILEKIWENHRILHSYGYKTTSFGLRFALWMTRMLSVVYKKFRR